MNSVQRFLAYIGFVWLSSGFFTVQAQEPVEELESRPVLVAAPQFQGELPDGTPVIALIVVPAENILKKNSAWQSWEQQWTTRYRLTPADEETE